MKGRKPKENAIRRGTKPADILAAQQSTTGKVELAFKPDEVLVNKNLSDLWDISFGDGTSFQAADVPVMAEYVFLLESQRQLRECLFQEDGRTINHTLKQVDEDGNYRPIQNAMMKELRALDKDVLEHANALGLTPLGRTRKGVLDSASGAMGMMSLSLAATLSEVVEGR